MRPRVVASRCLGFEACRYNREKVDSPEVDELRGHVEFITVCPEVDAGLGVPRNPINLQKHGDQLRVIQVGTELDLTEELVNHINETLIGLRDVDAFILKARSPSCGLGSTPVWDQKGENVVGQGSGVFACEAQRRFPGSIFLDEEELSRIGVEGLLRFLEA
ncbi:MAG: DUF523 domain-containing protein [Candidatus Bathyarchaeota archaeon]